MADSEHVDFSGVAAADVVFVCSRDDESSLHIKVSSTIVRNCSPVFNALLGPHFREGTTLAAAHFVTIDLPDDDADSMKLLFAIMHTKHHTLARDLGLAALKSLAVVVDKYDCTETAAALAYYWINMKVESASTANLRDLLQAAYHFRQHEFFEKIARTLVLDSEEPIRGESGVLAEVCNALEDQRKGSLLELANFIEGMVSRSCNLKAFQANGCLPTCAAQDVYGAAIVRYLTTRNLWPAVKTAKTSIGDLLLEMNMVDFEGITVGEAYRCTPPGSIACSCVAHHLFASDRAQEFTDQANSTETRLRKMCLRCVLGGSVFNTEQCSHEKTDRAFGAV